MIYISFEAEWQGLSESERNARNGWEMAELAPKHWFRHRGYAQIWWEELFTSFWAHFLSNPDVSYIIRNGTMSSIWIWKHVREILKSDRERPRILNLCGVTALRLERSPQALLNTKGTSGRKWFGQQGLEDECRTSVACLIAVTLFMY